jgi:hypothetical protein
MEPITVEVIAYAPTAFYHCTHCEVVWKEVGMGDRVHREQVNSALPDDLRADYQALSNWAQQLVERACGRVVLKVVDAASVEGFIKSLRYRARRYPTVIVQGENPYVTTELAEAEAEIARRLESELVMVCAP